MSQAQNLPAAPSAQVGKSLVNKFAERYSIDADKLLPILKATAFKLPPAKRGEEQPVVSNEQMAALLVVADQYKLNPFTKEIYAFPDKSKGIVPIVSVDGWERIINEHPMLDGVEFREAEQRVRMDDDAKECPEWIECTIYRKDRSRAFPVREYLDECYRPAFSGTGQNGPYRVPGPWQSHTKRFLRHKALIQAARVNFGFAGIYDAEDAPSGWGSGPIIDLPAPQQEPETYDTAPFNAAIVAHGIPADDPHLAAFIQAAAGKDRMPADRVKVEAAADMDNFVAAFRSWVEKNYPPAKSGPAKKPSTPKPSPKPDQELAPEAETPAMPETVECKTGAMVRTAVECAKCADRETNCPQWEEAK